MEQHRTKKLKLDQNHFLGYPCNIDYDYSELYDTLKFHFNNVGDPFKDSLYRVNSRQEEKEVLDFFKEVWHFDKHNVWGYITHNGTEGNMQGLYVGREVFPEGVFYCSEDSHYSLFKIARILKMKLCVVKSRENGEINYDDFEYKLKDNINYPSIICVNIGTTMKGAIDDPREIYRILCKHGKQNDYYMHADGALMGFLLPYIEKDIFFKKCINSIAISGHKFLGIPFPCGVFMMQKHFLEMITNDVEYIGSTDNTISGSRNGHSPVFMNYIIKQKGMGGFEKDVLSCLDNSEYLINKLQEIGINAWRNRNSTTVVFKKPSMDLVKKWQLAIQGDICHIVVMQHVNKDKIDKFIEDIKNNK